MLLILERRLQESVSELLRTRYNVDIPILVEQPKQPEFGEMAVPAAFQLARQLRKAPKAIAAEIMEGLPPIPGIERIEIAGNGYLNVRLDRAEFGSGVLTPEPNHRAARAAKIIVEHTNINPNKSAHIGHLRNAILGDTFVRMLRATSQQVEVQNYIDNTGVQVADVVVGFHHLLKKSYAEVEALTKQPRFDYYCWDLYARISQHYKDAPESLEWRKQTLHDIESGQGEIAEIAHLVADAIVKSHIATMLRLGIRYDLLPRESEILHLQFWATAFELLKQRNAIYLETEGKNAGCWVMPGSAFSEHKEDEDSKVIVRSNGTVTYVGKDIAYQLWKFGLLGKDFFYREWGNYDDGHKLWVTTEYDAGAPAPKFGGGSKVYNVIDSRQSYLQDVVVAGLNALDFHEQAEASVHFSYEMVALTPATCVELGIELSEEDKKRSYVEVSGRKGLGVKADDLIDTLIAKALEEVESRHPEASEEERRKVATQIAVGALRFFMLKFTRNTVIAFDLREALSFEGETGPYVQYAAVRAGKILQRLTERGEQVPEFRSILTKEAMARQLASEDFWQLLLSASRHEMAIERAVSSGEPAHLARYAFQVAQSFNNFYHAYPILREEDPERRAFLLWLADYFRSQLERTLGVLGIEVPPYM